MKKHENKMMPLSTFTQQTHQRGADLGLHLISEIDQLCETKHLLHGAKIASRFYVIFKIFTICLRFI